jgi:hypothetical protein
MSEVRVAHFRYRHEADMARGFLDDADIPCRLISDDAAGGAAYLGGLAGAWVLVREEHGQGALEVLESAGMLTALQEPTGPAADLARRADALPPVPRSELDDLTRALEKARKDEFKYFVLCLLGVSPAAVIPLAGLVVQEEIALFLLLAVLVVLSEGWKGIKAGREVKRLEAALASLEEETRD